MRIVKSIVFFCMLSFLFWASYAFADDCGCNSCHGNPPIYDNVYGGPYGLVPTGSGTAGAHAKHAPESGISQNNICYKCHVGGMPYTSMCGNFKIQIGFDIFGFSGTGSAYDGKPLNVPYSYEGTNGTVVTTGNSKVCSNIYCHSNGTAVTTRIVSQNSSPAWGGGQTLTCNSCHGNTDYTDYRKAAPLYAQDQPKSNSHLRHINFTCNYCHYPTTHDGVAIADISKHANAVYDLAPDPNALYYPNGYLAGVPVNFNYSYDKGGGTCSNVSCHIAADGWYGTINWGRVTISPVSANWAATSNCDEVAFTNTQASGGTPPYTWLWDFGDGTTSTEQYPTHVFPSSDTYYVKLTARDAYNHPGTTTLMVTPVAPNTPPVVKLSIVSLTGYALTVKDESYDPDYNKCGHKGTGTISIKWYDPYNLSASTNASINLTDVPSNTTYSYTYNKQNVSQSIWINNTVTDNAGGKASAVLGVTIPEIMVISGRIANAGGVPLSNVAVYRKTSMWTTPDQGPTMVYTNANGDYSFSSGVVAGACYYIEPYKAGYAFTPGYKQVCEKNVGLNFISSP